MHRIILSVLGVSFSASLAQADIVKSSPDHFTLKHEATSNLSPDDLWTRLIDPASWWHPDHSFSGKSEHFSLDPKAGGLWLEAWDDGSVAHGEILYISAKDKTLRLNAPFGPMQEMAVTAIWTIKIEPHNDGSKVIFDEVVNGTSESALDELAPAVDYVKTEAINRLVSGENYAKSDHDQQD